MGRAAVSIAISSTTTFRNWTAGSSSCAVLLRSCKQCAASLRKWGSRLNESGRRPSAAPVHSHAPRTAESGFTVEFASSGKTGAVIEGQTLLEAATAAGIEIPSACRQGQCGTCKTRLLAGDVQMTAEQGLDPESKARGFVLTCVGHANGNVRLDT